MILPAAVPTLPATPLAPPSPGPASPPAALPTIGLLLTGGGARAAYQVGVLQAIAQMRREACQTQCGNPFPVITGTSAGAVNAAALACGAADFDRAVRRLARVWRQFKPDQVYSTRALASLDVAGRWRMLWGVTQLLARWRRHHPRSLLDNTPLARLIERLLPLSQLQPLMQAGHLQALAVSASSYSSGDHFTFYERAHQAAPMPPWTRSQRQAVPGPLQHAHLLASSAIPFVFPATALQHAGHTEYFGDGSMRQSAPIAPAIHLGAERILVVGSGRLHEPRETPGPNTHNGYPSLAQIAGHAMSSIFLDALAVDVERLQRINHTLSLIPPEARAHTHLRPIELMVITPSERIDRIAARHVDELPGVVRRLFHDRGAPGGADTQAVKSSALASYLLFDSGFTCELMALGRADTLAQRAEVGRFFGWPLPAPGSTGLSPAGRPPAPGAAPPSGGESVRWPSADAP